MVGTISSNCSQRQRRRQRDEGVREREKGREKNEWEKIRGFWEWAREKEKQVRTLYNCSADVRSVLDIMLSEFI